VRISQLDCLIRELIKESFFFQHNEYLWYLQEFIPNNNKNEQKLGRKDVKLPM
jgi:hypothetical protein